MADEDGFEYFLPEGVPCACLVISSFQNFLFVCFVVINLSTLRHVITLSNDSLVRNSGIADSTEEHAAYPNAQAAMGAFGMAPPFTAQLQQQQHQQQQQQQYNPYATASSMQQLLQAASAMNRQPALTPLSPIGPNSRTTTLRRGLQQVQGKYLLIA